MKCKPKPNLYVAIPVLQEYENIQNVIHCIKNQTYTSFSVLICVNQPDEWWDYPEMVNRCLDNKKTIEWLNTLLDFPLTLIDRSAPGKGWIGKKRGVGEARKQMFDQIASMADPGDLIVSLDADTSFPDDYFESVVSRFDEYPFAGGMAVPYFHKTIEDAAHNPVLLYYEIYMRYYVLNLLHIHSPYAFTALGSALVFPVWVYRKIGGMAAMEAGEDFYLLQKIKKTAQVLLWNRACVYPSGRISDRVPFGTGPAVKGDIKDLLVKYPLYAVRSFELIKTSYALFPSLYKQPISLPVDTFLQLQLKTNDVWDSLRKNYTSCEHFVKACHERFDGLRILQFLKYNQPEKHPNENELCEFVEKRYGLKVEPFEWEKVDIPFLSALRTFLFEKEMEERKNHDLMITRK